ncbi:neutral ceramidase 2-like protein [Tanacetum coccineum]|uniref:Neutral ceramidase n=1 Tax=Tanacetum coccineum TaxID=301880 RepID=A0ABQ5G5F6_9ASTR
MYSSNEKIGGIKEAIQRILDGSMKRLPRLSCSVLQNVSVSMWLLATLLLVLLVKCSGESTTLIGLGSYDITGPAGREPQGKSLVFVNLDACMASQIVTIKVIERLKARYGDLYTEENVGISGIHTHAGPGGYLQYVVYIITSLGFVQQSFDVLVDGIEKSIIQAHENLRPGSVFINTGELLDASINRSPSGYLNNPEEERRKYKYDTDKEMTLLKFVDDTWGPVGSFNWFATHGTSMSRTNSLISGDNKGAAARFMEDWYNSNVTHKGFEIIQSVTDSGASYYRVPRRICNIIPNYHEHRKKLMELASSFRSSPGRPVTRALSVSKRLRSSFRQAERPQFVSAFCQSNCGDVSPNVLGAFCIDTGLPCDFNQSTCNGRNELCYGRGPGYPDEFESTASVVKRQFKKAAELFESASEQLKGKVGYRHSYIDFSDLSVRLSNVNESVRTCPAAMGFAFAAGTTDGPGAFDFTQGDDQPSILPVQIFQIGQLVILNVPGEFTTMAGRRLRQAVKEVMTSGNKDSNVHVVIAGLTNTYSQYVTTFEEYQIQRYEGASTLYGPHTLNAYIQEFKKLASSLISDQKVEPGPQPPNLLDKQISLLTPVVMDATPLGLSFGDCKTDVPPGSIFKRGDVVTVMFWSACPRNDLMTEGTYALVEILQSDKNWEPAYDDDDWCLKFKWSRPSKLSTRSYATIEWEIPDMVVSGVYRITHFGASKSLFGSVNHFTGSSAAFTVT